MLCGIDLGGTKIEAALIDPVRPDTALGRVRVPTGQEHGYAHVLGQIEAVCRKLEKETGHRIPERLGLGHPGTLRPSTQCLSGSNTQCLNGKPIKQDIEQRLDREVVAANDANCFALAEADLGAGRGFETVFGIIIGTGVGGGLVVDGKVLGGRHGIAGEWGQVVLDPQGPVSVYGTRGTIEAHLAGPALEKFYYERTGEKLPLREIVARAGESEPATATLERLTDSFAAALAVVVNVFDPHAIVIGGGVGNIEALYTEETRRKIETHIFNGHFLSPLLKPRLGDSAGVFGAALLTSGAAFATQKEAETARQKEQ